MDYKKKYEEVLERAKIELSADTTQGTKNVLMTIFPELKNEDEKIKKELIELISYMHNADPRKKGWLAWLEKQGDCSAKWEKNTADNKPTLYHSVLMKTTHGIVEGECQGERWFQYRWSWTLKESNVLAWMELSDLDEQGEQKPFDKVEPFDKYEGLTDFERTLADICIGWIGEELGWKQYIKDNADVLLKIAIKKFNSIQDAPFEQKPTWSKYDEEMLRSCTGAIWAADSCLYEEKQEIEAWLKRIKDRIGG